VPAAATEARQTEWPGDGIRGLTATRVLLGRRRYRVTSPLAQLPGGIVEAIRAETADTVEGAEAKLLGIGGKGASSRTGRADDSRPVQVPTFVAFEEYQVRCGFVDWFRPQDYDRFDDKYVPPPAVVDVAVASSGTF
jgi:hypothetical protein